MQKAYVYRIGEPKGHTVTPAAYPLWSGTPIAPEEPPYRPHRIDGLEVREAERVQAHEHSLHH